MDRSMDDMKAKLISKASEADMATDEAYDSASPEGEYSLSTLNSLVDSLNDVLPLFQVEPYAEFTEVPMSLPGEFVKLLSMVADAAEEADEETFSVSDLTDDSALQYAAGVLGVLRKSKDFKRFLSTMPKEEAESEEIAPVIKKEMSAPVDTMKLFTSRMK